MHLDQHARCEAAGGLKQVGDILVAEIGERSAGRIQPGSRA